MSAALLSVSGLCAGYGDIAVLRDVSLEVTQGSVVAVLGANGAGKTTLLSAIAGLIPTQSGETRFAGSRITGKRADQLTGQGLAMVPEGGRLFPFMTVWENLQLGAFTPGARADLPRRLEEMFSLFPVLRDRATQHAGKLSGGERQMCAIARALMSGPRLLLLDEPSIGLSPLMTERVLDTVRTLARDRGLTVVIVEQRVSEVLEVADIAHVLDHGRIVRSGLASALRDDRQIQETYMGL